MKTNFTITTAAFFLLAVMLLATSPTQMVAILQT